jgi:endonuclease YncB( thermonuclease family)
MAKPKKDATSEKGGTSPKTQNISFTEEETKGVTPDYIAFTEEEAELGNEYTEDLKDLFRGLGDYLTPATPEEPPTPSSGGSFDDKGPQDPVSALVGGIKDLAEQRRQGDVERTRAAVEKDRQRRADEAAERRKSAEEEWQRNAQQRAEDVKALSELETVADYYKGGKALGWSNPEIEKAFFDTYGVPLFRDDAAAKVYTSAEDAAYAQDLPTERRQYAPAAAQSLKDLIPEEAPTVREYVERSKRAGVSDPEQWYAGLKKEFNLDRDKIRFDTPLQRPNDLQRQVWQATAHLEHLKKQAVVDEDLIKEVQWVVQDLKETQAADGEDRYQAADRLVNMYHDAFVERTRQAAKNAGPEIEALLEHGSAKGMSNLPFPSGQDIGLPLSKEWVRNKALEAQEKNYGSREDLADSIAALFEDARTSLDNDQPQNIRAAILHAIHTKGLEGPQIVDYLQADLGIDLEAVGQLGLLETPPGMEEAAASAPIYRGEPVEGASVDTGDTWYQDPVVEAPAGWYMGPEGEIGWTGGAVPPTHPLAPQFAAKQVVDGHFGEGIMADIAERRAQQQWLTDQRNDLFNMQQGRGQELKPSNATWEEFFTEMWHQAPEHEREIYRSKALFDVGDQFKKFVGEEGLQELYAAGEINPETLKKLSDKAVKRVEQFSASPEDFDSLSPSEQQRLRGASLLVGANRLLSAVVEEGDALAAKGISKDSPVFKVLQSKALDDVLAGNRGRLGNILLRHTREQYEALANPDDPYGSELVAVWERDPRKTEQLRADLKKGMTDSHQAAIDTMSLRELLAVAMTADVVDKDDVGEIPFGVWTGGDVPADMTRDPFTATISPAQKTRLNAEMARIQEQVYEDLWERAVTSPGPRWLAPQDINAPKVRVQRVVDGDTIIVNTPTHGPIRVRITGINTPEIGTFGADAATAYLSQLVLNQEVQIIDSHVRDPYNRVLADLRLADGTAVSHLMMQAGHAKRMEMNEARKKRETAEKWVRGLAPLEEYLPPGGTLANPEHKDQAVNDRHWRKLAWLWAQHERDRRMQGRGDTFSAETFQGRHWSPNDDLNVLYNWPDRFLGNIEGMVRAYASIFKDAEIDETLHDAIEVQKASEEAGGYFALASDPGKPVAVKRLMEKIANGAERVRRLQYAAPGEGYAWYRVPVEAVGVEAFPLQHWEETGAGGSAPVFTLEEAYRAQRAADPPKGIIWVEIDTYHEDDNPLSVLKDEHRYKRKIPIPSEFWGLKRKAMALDGDDSARRAWARKQQEEHFQGNTPVGPLWEGIYTRTDAAQLDEVWASRDGRKELTEEDIIAWSGKSRKEKWDDLTVDEKIKLATDEDVWNNLTELEKFSLLTPEEQTKYRPQIATIDPEHYAADQQFLILAQQTALRERMIRRQTEHYKRVLADTSTGLLGDVARNSAEIISGLWDLAGTMLGTKMMPGEYEAMDMGATPREARAAAMEGMAKDMVPAMMAEFRYTVAKPDSLWYQPMDVFLAAVPAWGASKALLHASMRSTLGFLDTKRARMTALDRKRLDAMQEAFDYVQRNHELSEEFLRGVNERGLSLDRQTQIGEMQDAFVKGADGVVETLDDLQTMITDFDKPLASVQDLTTKNSKRPLTPEQATPAGLRRSVLETIEQSGDGKNLRETVRVKETVNALEDVAEDLERAYKDWMTFEDSIRDSFWDPDTPLEDLYEPIEWALRREPPETAQKVIEKFKALDKIEDEGKRSRAGRAALDAFSRRLTQAYGHRMWEKFGEALQKRSGIPDAVGPRHVPRTMGEKAREALLTATDVVQGIPFASTKIPGAKKARPQPRAQRSLRDRMQEIHDAIKDQAPGLQGEGLRRAFTDALRQQAPAASHYSLWNMMRKTHRWASRSVWGDRNWLWRLGTWTYTGLRKSVVDLGFSTIHSIRADSDEALRQGPHMRAAAEGLGQIAEMDLDKVMDHSFTGEVPESTRQKNARLKAEAEEANGEKSKGEQWAPDDSPEAAMKATQREVTRARHDLWSASAVSRWGAPEAAQAYNIAMKMDPGKDRAYFLTDLTKPQHLGETIGTKVQEAVKQTERAEIRLAEAERKLEGLESDHPDMLIEKPGPGAGTQIKLQAINEALESDGLLDDERRMLLAAKETAEEQLKAMETVAAIPKGVQARLSEALDTHEASRKALLEAERMVDAHADQLERTLGDGAGAFDDLDFNFTDAPTGGARAVPVLELLGQKDLHPAVRGALEFGDPALVEQVLQRHKAVNYLLPTKGKKGQKPKAYQKLWNKYVGSWMADSFDFAKADVDTLLGHFYWNKEYLRKWKDRTDWKRDPADAEAHLREIVEELRRRGIEPQIDPFSPTLQTFLDRQASFAEAESILKIAQYEARQFFGGKDPVSGRQTAGRGLVHVLRDKPDAQVVQAVSKYAKEVARLKKARGSVNAYKLEAARHRLEYSRNVLRQRGINPDDPFPDLVSTEIGDAASVAPKGTWEEKTTGMTPVMVSLLERGPANKGGIAQMGNDALAQHGAALQVALTHKIDVLTTYRDRLPDGPERSRVVNMLVEAENDQVVLAERRAKRLTEKQGGFNGVRHLEVDTEADLTADAAREGRIQGLEKFHEIETQMKAKKTILETKIEGQKTQSDRAAESTKEIQGLTKDLAAAKKERKALREDEKVLRQGDFLDDEGEAAVKAPPNELAAAKKRFSEYNAKRDKLRQELEASAAEVAGHNDALAHMQRGPAREKRAAALRDSLQRADAVRQAYNHSALQCTETALQALGVKPSVIDALGEKARYYESETSKEPRFRGPLHSREIHKHLQEAGYTLERVKTTDDGFTAISLEEFRRRNPVGSFIVQAEDRAMALIDGEWVDAAREASQGWAADAMRLTRPTDRTPSKTAQVTMDLKRDLFQEKEKALKDKQRALDKKIEKLDEKLAKARMSAVKDDQTPQIPGLDDPAADLKKVEAELKGLRKARKDFLKKADLRIRVASRKDTFRRALQEAEAQSSAPTHTVKIDERTPLEREWDAWHQQGRPEDSKPRRVPEKHMYRNSDGTYTFYDPHTREEFPVRENGEILDSFVAVKPGEIPKVALTYIPGLASGLVKQGSGATMKSRYVGAAELDWNGPALDLIERVRETLGDYLGKDAVVEFFGSDLVKALDQSRVEFFRSKLVRDAVTDNVIKRIKDKIEMAPSDERRFRTSLHRFLEESVSDKTFIDGRANAVKGHALVIDVPGVGTFDLYEDVTKAVATNPVLMEKVTRDHIRLAAQRAGAAVASRQGSELWLSLRNANGVIDAIQTGRQIPSDVPLTEFRHFKEAQRLLALEDSMIYKGLDQERLQAAQRALGLIHDDSWRMKLSVDPVVEGLGTARDAVYEYALKGGRRVADPLVEKVAASRRDNFEKYVREYFAKVEKDKGASDWPEKAKAAADTFLERHNEQKAVTRAAVEESLDDRRKAGAGGLVGDYSERQHMLLCESIWSKAVDRDLPSVLPVHPHSILQYLDDVYGGGTGTSVLPDAERKKRRNEALSALTPEQEHRYRWLNSELNNRYTRAGKELYSFFGEETSQTWVHRDFNFAVKWHSRALHAVQGDSFGQRVIRAIKTNLTALSLPTTVNNLGAIYSFGMLNRGDPLLPLRWMESALNHKLYTSGRLDSAISVLDRVLDPSFTGTVTPDEVRALNGLSTFQMLGDKVPDWVPDIIPQKWRATHAGVSNRGTMMFDGLGTLIRSKDGGRALTDAVANGDDWVRALRDRLHDEREMRRAIDQTGVQDATRVEGELGGYAKAGLLTESFKEAVVQRMAWLDLDTLMDKGARAMDAAAEKHLQMYRLSENIPKMEHTVHRYRVYRNFFEEAGENTPLIFQTSVGRETTMTRLPDGKIQIERREKGGLVTHVVDEDSPLVANVLADAAAVDAQRLYFDYTDMPFIGAFIRSSRLIDAVNPFFSWSIKALALPIDMLFPGSGVRIGGKGSKMTQGALNIVKHQALEMGMVAAKRAVIAMALRAHLNTTAGAEFFREISKFTQADNTIGVVEFMSQNDVYRITDAQSTWFMSSAALPLRLMSQFHASLDDWDLMDIDPEDPDPFNMDTLFPMIYKKNREGKDTDEIDMGAGIGGVDYNFEHGKWAALKKSSPAQWKALTDALKARRRTLLAALRGEMGTKAELWKTLGIGESPVRVILDAMQEADDVMRAGEGRVSSAGDYMRRIGPMLISNTLYRTVVEPFIILAGDPTSGATRMSYEQAYGPQDEPWVRTHEGTFILNNFFGKAPKRVAVKEQIDKAVKTRANFIKDGYSRPLTEALEAVNDKIKEMHLNDVHMVGDKLRPRDPAKQMGEDHDEVLEDYNELIARRDVLQDLVTKAEAREKAFKQVYRDQLERQHAAHKEFDKYRKKRTLTNYLQSKEF